MRYWDASGIVPLLVAEAHSKQVQRLLEKESEIVTWWGTTVECLSALMRVVREGGLSADDLERALRRLEVLRDGWSEVLPTEACRRVAERMLRVHALRAADALQLAAAVIAADYDPGRIEMVSLDQRLSEASRKEGFAVVP